MYIFVMERKNTLHPAKKSTFSDLLRVPSNIISYWGPLSKPDNKNIQDGGVLPWTGMWHVLFTRMCHFLFYQNWKTTGFFIRSFL
jgi:hypothetical protein